MTKPTFPRLRRHFVAFSLLLLTPALFAQTSRPATTRSTTATKPAIDRSSPEKTWTALCNSVKAGDVGAFRACYYNKNEVCTLFMNAYSDLVVTSFQLATAMAPMGADGQAMANDLQSAYTDMVKTGQNRKTTITGDTAKWTRTHGNERLSAEEFMLFKKVGTDWLVDTEQSLNLDTAEGRKSAEDFVTSSAPTLKALKSVLADIRAKKITTVAQVKARLAIQPKP
jgi:hypothetical protein